MKKSIQFEFPVLRLRVATVLQTADPFLEKKHMLIPRSCCDQSRLPTSDTTANIERCCTLRSETKGAED
jgi:hypothetical protein